ncbi:ABC transporter permease [Alkalicoccobacillus plakortidis]|uniref:ABC transporter permease n=1 Tax=Alkalicoccobacillus plakortidis TaxID=444060 RepID=A0ABT0XG66_9BACI|nr:ABC transporter permease [Alkalicoccobacillus plakortidis]MCM2674891.1 ABC transporter permease [Alkalicoccobacillus plakortidis]
MILPTIKYTGVRMIREYIGMLLLFVLPLVLISIFHLILGDLQNEGLRVFDSVAISMVLAFQLFGGSYPMGYIQEDLFTHRKWRLKSLPINRSLYAFSVMFTGAIFSILQGFAIVLITYFAFGVDWGHFLWALFVISLLSTLSSLVCTLCALVTTNFKVAERLSEVYGIGSIVLAGMFFSLPDNAFFHFMGTYGNPLSLAQTALFEQINNGDFADIWVAILILATAIVVCFVVAILIGRRKIQ